MCSDDAAQLDPSRQTLLICFLHDHLREIMTVQSSIIEAALLGDDFVNAETRDRLRFAASVYASYADQIDMRLTNANEKRRLTN